MVTARRRCGPAARAAAGRSLPLRHALPATRFDRRRRAV
ncbi:hypothetical protein GLE_1808 [Lysobacter enzymogenes]|uniref:Uncharacterized protein n=1 Tax=Lysobacter enzymogenes TaxID=69 RepID=A0A0S2DFM9_LYSEN|nr:hypothetical protein GLE_1808 [Lysobacter enzymogenes]